MDTLPSQLCLIAVFVLITALYRSAENAVEDISEAKISRLAEEGNKKAARLLKLIEAPNQLYDSIRLIVIPGYRHIRHLHRFYRNLFLWLVWQLFCWF